MNVFSLCFLATRRIHLEYVRHRSKDKSRPRILCKGMNQKFHLLPLYCLLFGGTIFCIELLHHNIFLYKGYLDSLGDGLLDFQCDRTPDICSRSISLLPMLFDAIQMIVCIFGIRLVCFWDPVTLLV